jgi:hypothetical protein
MEMTNGLKFRFGLNFSLILNEELVFTYCLVKQCAPYCMVVYGLHWKFFMKYIFDLQVVKGFPQG